MATEAAGFPNVTILTDVTKVNMVTIATRGSMATKAAVVNK